MRWYKDGAPTTLGSKDLFDVCQELPIPKDDWIVRVIVTVHDTSTHGVLNETQRKVVGLRFTFSKRDPVQFGQAQGYQRVLAASEGCVAVGFRATWSSGRPLAKLAILQQKTRNTPLGSETRLTTEVPSSFFVIERFLWKNELPPDHLHLTYACVEGEECDRWLIEPPIFGTTDDELSNMISIAVDVQLGGFETAYKDGTRRTIGHRRNAIVTKLLGPLVPVS